MDAAFTCDAIIFTFSDRSLANAGGQSTPDLPSRKQEVRRTRVDFRFLNANPAVQPAGMKEMDGKIHVFKDADPSKWRTDIPTYLQIVYPELWPGIDLVFRSEGPSIKYEFIVHPGADEHDIRFAYAGAENVSLDEEGNLIIGTLIGAVIDPRPVCYQEANGRRIEVPGSFLLESTEPAGHAIGFRIGGSYDRSVPLVIDPGLIYSTYLGGSGNDEPFGIAVDASGSVYVTGITTSTDFPITPGAVQTTFAGDREVFISKLNPNGTALVYSTYLGGSASDSGQNIAVDAAGNAYITGRTYSDNFPVTPGAVQTTFGGSSDVFVTKLNAAGSALVYSTYLGGTGHDYGLGIAIDSAGEAYVTGFTASADFPTTAGAFQTVYGGNNDGFISKLNAAGSSLVYSTFLGGSGGDNGTAITVDSAGNAYVTGNTASANFPTTAGAFQTSRRGTGDVFATKINPTGSALVYSTYLGGSLTEYGYGISVDAAGNAYVGGYTRSADYPTTPGAYQPAFGGTNDAFMTKLNPGGSALVYSTYLGRTNTQIAYGSGLDPLGNAFLAGYTLSDDFPTTPDAIQTTIGGPRDAFATKFNPDGSALVYSTLLGGAGVDSGSAITGDAAGSMYVTGYTLSSDFPVTPGAFQTTLGGLVDVFVAKFGLVPDLTVAKTSDRTDVMPGDTVTYSFTLTNSGEVRLTGIRVEDPLLDLTEVIAALEPGMTQTLTRTFVVPAATPPGTFTNTVTVTADQLAQSRTAAATINVASSPALTFAKTVDPSTAAPGETVTYTITAVNTGNVDFTGIVLTDPLLGLNETIDRLAVGTQATFIVPFLIPTDAISGSTLVNTAAIQGDNLSLRQATASVLVLGVPGLALSKSVVAVSSTVDSSSAKANTISVFPGDTVEFTIEARNTGSVALTNIVVTDELAGLSRTIPLLAVGASEIIRTTFLVPLESPPRVYTNNVEAVSDQTSRVTASAAVEILPAPLIGVRKVPETNVVTPGQVITYRITLANPGNVPLTGVRVLDPLLGVNIAVPDLAVGETREVLLPFTVPATASIGTEIANLLTVATDQTDPAQVLSVVTVTGNGLSLSKTADTASASPGAVINYVLTVTNLLSTPQTNVVLSDLLLGINETVASLAAGGTIVRAASFVVPLDAANGSLITNEFEAVSDQTALQRTSVSVAVQAIPGAPTTLALLKRPDRNAVAPGGTVIYTVEVTNTGNNSATAIVVSDSLTGTQETIPSLGPGQVAYVQFPFVAPASAVQGTTFDNIATADWPERPAGTLPPQSFARIIIGLQRFLLDLTNVVAPAVADPGTIAVFTVTVRNQSQHTLTNVRVIEPLTAFSTLLPSLLPGESRSFDRPFTIPSDAVGGTIFTSHAVAFSDQTPFQQAPASVTTTRLPNAALEHTVDRPVGRSGETVYFTIRARNTGNVVLVDGILKAPLFNLVLRSDSFAIGADYLLRIPFILPDAIEDTTIVSRVTTLSQNGPLLEAAASVLVIVDEE